MSTKTCKRCGWVYPIAQPGTKCLICGEPFELVACRVCGSIFEANTSATKLNTRCPKCAYIAQLASKHKRTKNMHKRFDDWVAKVSKVPKSYPTLTEAQWLEACNYFNGCARCDSDEIDTRGFFIGKELGGRYCDWNVIPLCTRCATMWKLDKSVFAYAYGKGLKKANKLYRPLGVTDDPKEFTNNLENIVKYLGVRLDNAIRSIHDNEETERGS